jgi:16S rRNA (cytosine967-C5)-methyltransferase
MREDALIRRVNEIIEDFSFEEPLAIYLKKYFRRHPKMGARDRRDTREWAYNYFRIGKNLADENFEIRLAVACFLCSQRLSNELQYLIDRYLQFNANDIERDIAEKLIIVRKKFPAFSTKLIFQMYELLSPEIDSEKWALSFLEKPRVWIRIRNSFRNKIIDELKGKAISFLEDDDSFILSFDPAVPLEKTESFSRGFFEIQDKSSQCTKQFFNPKQGDHWWDACAGSGGKSLLLIEECPEIKIYATDVRSSILENYSARVEKTGFKAFRTQVIDLTKSSLITGEGFQGIIADVPCSGSGTWSRSPEWLNRNIEGRVENFFVPLQRKIISSVIPLLEKGSPLIYITCSVFEKENEENIHFFLEHFPLKLEKSTYLKGYESRSDTLFIARFIKNL